MYKRILIPLDGSELAEAVLPHARALAQAGAAEIVLLRVVMHPVYEYLASDPLVSVEVHENAEAEAREYLARVEAELRSAGFRVSTQVGDGPVGDTIIQTAEQAGVDLIAMSTHGRGGFTRWVIGSVADQVIRRAAVPVLLIRPPAEKKRVSV